MPHFHGALQKIHPSDLPGASRFFREAEKQLGAVPSPYMFQALSFGVKLESIHTLLSLIKKSPPLTQHDHVFSISDGTYMIFFIVYASNLSRLHMAYINRI